MARKLRISVSEEVLILSRFNAAQPRLVYVLTANKKLKYRYGRSAIAYIGTTKRGLKRIAESVADKSQDIFGNHGVTTLTAHLLTSRGRRGAQTWKKLERALIISFRERYGEVPKYNNHGRGWQRKDEGKYFCDTRIRELVERGEQ